ncbi:hypothetical protein HYH02_000890 [Chlamydomonas schloesseri]|uniref:Uncharacterized protein n=1 Tax=Chlamydomonas schloesseri TaxID=2026947 RepID=A0A835WWH8_9CHLO|nr:hypothetical protein HYH02_000890 [Chlamydomonas schloesseri]|eukprot:KAG2455065.1 hypothetical protein HYH02_000890 [Chlamydomonas schloesseri]
MDLERFNKRLATRSWLCSCAADWDAPARSGSSFLGAFSTPERAAATALENESPQSAPGRLSSSPEATHQQHPSQPPSGYHRAYSNVHRPRRPVQVVVVLEEDEEDEEDDGRDGGYSPHRALTMPSLSTPACAPPSRAASSTLAWAEAGGAASRSPRPTYSPAGCPPSATHGSGTASRRGSSGAVTTGGEATTGGMTPAAYVAAMRLRGTTGGMAGGGGGGTVNRSPSVTGERRRPSLSRFGITETAAGRSMSMTLVRQASLGGPGLSVTTGSPSSTSAGAYGGSLGGRCGGTGAAAGGVAAGAFSNRAVSLPAVSSFSSLRAAFLTGGSSLVPAAAAVTEPAAASAAAPESHDADTVPRVDAMHADTCCVHAAPALVSTCTPELAACGAGLMSLSSGEREA